MEIFFSIKTANIQIFIVLSKSINEKCARIRGAFVSKYDEDLAKEYYIFGWRGEAKKISLPSDLIVWKE